MSTQLFTFAGYISNGSLGAAGNTNPITGVSAGCATATTSECRWERLEGLFRFLQTKGVTTVEPFDHANIPSATATNLDTAGWQRYRTLLDRYGLHAGGWHGSTNEGNWGARIAAATIIGSDYLGSGGVADPGINSYAAVLASAQALNRMGKRSVEAGVGPAYVHNHDQEFLRQYVHNGVLTTAYDILLMETDPRYMVAELDVFWSSDTFGDATGVQSADFINKWGTRVQMLHIKDGINIAPAGPRNGSPRATGTGELDFRPIFAAAANRVRWYHMEQDGGSPHDANIAFTNLKGSGPTAVGTPLGLPTSFPAVAAGTPAASNVVPVVIQNTGDAALTITNATITGTDAVDFSVVSSTCTAAGGPLAPGALATDTTPAVPRGSCTVNVGFKPTRTSYNSVANLQLTSAADNATETILLTGTSTGQAIGTIGGDVGGNVGSALNLSVLGTGSFGTFVPGVARDYTTALAATVTSTAGDAALTVTDSDAVNPGKLVNGAFALASPFGVRAVGLGDNPLPAYGSLTGGSLALRSWSAPVTNDPLTIGFRQSIGATDALRAGTYSKTLTFSLSTTTP